MKSLDVLYELMRSALWGRPAVVDADFKDWGEVFAVAKSQSVLALVGHAALNNANVRDALGAASAQHEAYFLSGWVGVCIRRGYGETEEECDG